MRRKGTRDEAAAARDIEHDVLGPSAGRVDDHTQRRLASDRRGAVEGGRLAGELVEDQALVRVGHCCFPSRAAPRALSFNIRSP